ncbi:MAG TPA: EamA family transporter [Anaerolineales bacterium]|nr:EamA family transporter [Anaerolineales bacterium]
MSTKAKIWFALVAVYIFWGGTYLFIHFAVESIPPFFMAGSRFLIAGAALYVWRRLAGDPAPTPGQWLRAAGVGVLLLLGGNGLLSFAEQSVATGISSLIIGSVPLWMTTIEALRPGGARPNRLGILGLVVGFGGIALLVAPSLIGGKSVNAPLVGVIVLLFAAFFWSLGSIASRVAHLPESTLLSTGMQMLGGGAGLFLAGTFTGEWHSLLLAHITARSWGAMLYLVLFGSMIGYTAYAWLLRAAPVSLVATYAYVNPLVAILLGSLFAQETLSVHVLVSAAIIIGSVILINLSRRTAAPPAPVPVAE